MRGVNALEMRARSFVCWGGSAKIIQSGPYRELKTSESERTRFTTS
jgi:hypothetical protein